MAKGEVPDEIMEARAPVLMVNASRGGDLSSTAAIATLELCVLDSALDFYFGFLFFHEGRATGDGVEEPERRLRAALERLLVHYPCAAGVVVRKEADDGGGLEVKYPAIGDGKEGLHMASGSSTTHSYSFGVPFHVAHAAVALSDLGDPWLAPVPVVHSLHPPPAPLPDKLGSSNGRFVMAFQVTIFKCGGFCVGFTFNHVYMDGHAAAQLIQNLCSIARGAGLTTQPQHMQCRTMVFKPRSPPLPSLHPPFPIPCESTGANSPPFALGTSECLKIPLEEVEALRRHLSKHCQFGRCSRFASLLAILWSAHARVCLEVRKLPVSHVFILKVPMEMRKRQIRGVGVNYVGNAVCQLFIPATLQEICDNDLSDLANRIQNQIVGLDVVESMQSMVDFAELQMRDELSNRMAGLNVPSYVQFPFYDTDCGFGKPVYVDVSRWSPINTYFVLDNPAAQAWNMMFVLSSVEERACFEKHITKHMNSVLQ